MFQIFGNLDIFYHINTKTDQYQNRYFTTYPQRLLVSARLPNAFVSVNTLVSKSGKSSQGGKTNEPPVHITAFFTQQKVK